MLCFMTVFTFLLPCDNGAKVAIGLTVFLSLYVLQLAIAENIPEADSLPLISEQICTQYFSMVFTTFRVSICADANHVLKTNTFRLRSVPTE